MVALGGMRVCSWGEGWKGWEGWHAWLLWGVGVVGCSRGGCVVALGGACVVATRGSAWQKWGMHGKGGVCVAKGGMHGKKGGMHGKGGHAWQREGMHSERGVCMVCTPHEIRLVIVQAVRILLECILV